MIRAGWFWTRSSFAGDSDAAGRSYCDVGTALYGRLSCGWCGRIESARMKLRVDECWPPPALHAPTRLYKHTVVQGLAAVCLWRLGVAGVGGFSWSWIKWWVTYSIWRLKSEIFMSFGTVNSNSSLLRFFTLIFIRLLGEVGFVSETSSIDYLQYNYYLNSFD